MGIIKIAAVLGFLTTSSAVVVVPSAERTFLSTNASRTQSVRQQTRTSVGHLYGSNKCPCVGIDNLRGFFATTMDYYHVQYPLETGASCDSWEHSVHPDCHSEPMPSWCKQSWCYVDPCNCDLDILPKRTTMGIVFQGIPAYFSYKTCDAYDYWTAEKTPEACILQKDPSSCAQAPDCVWDGKQCKGKELVDSCQKTSMVSAETYGSQDCRCVGLGGRNNGQAARYINDDTSVVYDPNVGSTCHTWEMDAHPDCKKPGVKPNWCNQKWCFVDPCKCNLYTPPKAVMTANMYERYQGKTAYWSYATCGSVDFWTGTMKDEYCHTYADETSCKTLSKCMWTGGKCMGKALGKICSEQKETGILGMEYPMQPGHTCSLRPLVGVLFAFGLLVAS